jgi:hypothetical protein
MRLNPYRAHRQFATGHRCISTLFSRLVGMRTGSHGRCLHRGVRVFVYSLLFVDGLSKSMSLQGFLAPLSQSAFPGPENLEAQA